MMKFALALHILLSVFSVQNYTEIKKDIKEKPLVLVEKNNGYKDNDFLCYTEREMILLAKVIECEASDLCSNEHKMYVGQVVLNRVLNEDFPDNIYDVIYEKNQYACATGKIDKVKNCVPSNRSIEISKRLLNGERICSKNAVFQAEFPQGKIIATLPVYTSSGRLYSTTYICEKEGI